MASLVGKEAVKVVAKTVVRTYDRSGETFTFFFGKECVFSQWHSAEFKVDGVEYNCAEQYMMHQKAGEWVGLGSGRGMVCYMEFLCMMCEASLSSLEQIV